MSLSSVASKTGSPNEYIDYASTKGAIDTLTIGLSKELAEDGIRVNAVRPGYIYTDIHADGGERNRIERIKNSIPLKRGGRPDEVAKAILWLLSEEASFCTGTFIDVAGGR
jgi:NAD(P)-dependent dehydrogenase (short-subunit alcohol dehydrogenase family)